MEMDLHAQSKAARESGPFRAVIDAFDSVWLGIFWIAAILVYGAVGSAVPVFRQEFELTEFAFFNHWLFVTLIVMFCVTLAVVTLRRIAFNLRNLGVLTVHAGLLILCGASVIYFGRKIEGDVWLEAPRIRIISVDRMQSDPERAQVGSIVAVEGRKWEVDMPALGGRHRLEVTKVSHQGLVTAQRVELTARVGDGTPQTIELDQSERQNAFARLGDKLALWLVPANVSDVFFDESTPVLQVENRGHAETFELPMLPYYKERFVELAPPIVDTHGKLVASDRCSAVRPFEHWRMPIDLDDPHRAIHDDWPITLAIDGYLPYARLEPEPTAGGTRVMPIAQVRLEAGSESREDWLVAHLPERSSLELPGGPMAEFRWLGAARELDPNWTRPLAGRHVLEVYVKDKDVRKSYDVSEGMKIKIEGTDYKLTVEELRENWPLMTAGFQNARTPIALVWVETPEQSYQRSVLQRYPELNQDRDRAGKKISPDKNLVDDNLELTYFDASHDHFMLVAGEGLSPTLIHTSPGGKRAVSIARGGETTRSESGAAFALASFIEKPSFEMKPVVIPERSRRAFGTVRRGESLVRVYLRAKDGDWERHVWVPFSMYNTRHDGTEATVVRDVPGMGEVRLVYGRAERPMPARLALEYLQTDFYPGRQQPSGWTSYFRFQTSDGQVHRARAYLNNTARVGEWTLFQSQAAGDHESWTVLGVGNREGVWSMLGGCVLITLGMIYAFCVKPVLVRRRREAIESANRGRRAPDRDDSSGEPPMTSNRKTGSASAAAARLMLLAALCVPGASAGAAEREIPAAAQGIRAIQDRIDVARLGALATQYSWRYATVDSWARDAIKNIHGPKPLYGLDPVVASFELLFNSHAYDDEAIIFIKDRALRKELTAHPVPISDAEQLRIVREGMVSRAFLALPDVSKRIESLNMDMLRKTAMDRLGMAMGYYDNIAATCTMVPTPDGTHDTPWVALATIAQHADGPHATSGTENIFSIYAGLKKAWLARDAEGINAGIAKLEQMLPQLAPEGVYPSAEQRQAEVRYRRMDLIWWGWVAYIVAFFVSIFAVASRYGWVRWVGIALLVVAIGLHGYDLGLRWKVIGRVPVANMYEAVVSSTWLGAVFGLVLELFSRKRVYLLASAMLGFFALSLPELLPTVIDNKLGGMMPILDDIMLRIHTVLIIASYAVITLAYAVANCYLFVSAFRDCVKLAQGTIGAQAGAIACLVAAKLGVFDNTSAALFVAAMASATAGGALTGVGLCGLLRRGAAAEASGPDAALFPVRRTVLEEFDRSHRVLLYTAMVALFVGIVLGAVWADYSWGRPWGWDPKEVFALNTWLVYAILIHFPFVVRRKALATSVLSVVGFAAMQFNWWVVNFYIVGLHSYA